MIGRNVSRDIEEMTASLRETLISAVNGRHGTAVSGSIGKGTDDGKSDYNFRLYYDARSATFVDDWKRVQETIAWWADRGKIIDGVWCRSIEEIDSTLSVWLEGEIATQELDWAIRGYNLPTDIHNQRIIEDPCGVLAAWKSRLDTYPPQLKQAILAKVLPFLRYWRAADGR